MRDDKCLLSKSLFRVIASRYPIFFRPLSIFIIWHQKKRSIFCVFIIISYIPTVDRDGTIFHPPLFFYWWWWCNSPKETIRMSFIAIPLLWLNVIYPINGIYCTYGHWVLQHHRRISKIEFSLIAFTDWCECHFSSVVLAIRIRFLTLLSLRSLS